MNFQNNIFKIKELCIDLNNLIGANIVRKKNIYFLKIYYFKIKINKNKYIQRKIENYYYEDKIDILISYKKKIIEILKSKLKFWFIINPFSGKKKGLKIFNEYKNLFLSRGIDISYYITEYKNDGLNFIKNIKKEELKTYDTIICLGGDGIIHEILNGFGLRNESNDNDYINFVKIGTIPTGSGCRLIENIFKKSNLDYSIENSIYIILKNEVILHSIHKYEILNKNENLKINVNNKDKIKEYKIFNILKNEKIIKINNFEKSEENNSIYKESENYKIKEKKLSKDQNLKNEIFDKEIIYGFYSFNFGYFSDVNLRSERYRYLGRFRFELYGYFKIFNKDIYKPIILYNKKDDNIKFPKLIDFYNDKFNKNNFNHINYKLYSALFLNLPYLMKNYNCAPNVSFNSNFFDVQIGPKFMGNFNFIKYAFFLNKAKHLKKDYKIVNFLTDKFMIKNDSKLFIINIDGEKYYGKALKCKIKINKFKICG